MLKVGNIIGECLFYYKQITIQPKKIKHNSNNENNGKQEDIYT
jgi:hypothetical protein